MQSATQVQGQGVKSQGPSVTQRVQKLAKLSIISRELLNFIQI